MANNQLQMDIESVSKLAKNTYRSELLKLSLPDGTEGPVLLTRTNDTVEVSSVKELLDEYRSRPERRKGTANLTDLDSFIAHVKRFMDKDSAVFACKDPRKPSLTCVLDYHLGGASSAPRFGEHRSHYAFPISEEWQAWTSKDNQAMGQADFARWVEDRLGDIVHPDMAGESVKLFQQRFGVALASPQQVLEMSRGLTVHAGEQVRQAVNLETGEVTVHFTTQHTDDRGRPLKLPGAFLLALPVFRFGKLFQVPARFRYRLNGGAITYSYSLHRIAEVFDFAVNEACERVEKETQLPLFAGAPE